MLFRGELVVLMDPHGRQFRYLRLSITDVCNFKCLYCLPRGYSKESAAGNAVAGTAAAGTAALSVREIRNLVTAFAKMGFSKVRITGGEPTVRSDLLEILQTVRAVSGVREVALSTNGQRLSVLARPLVDVGVSAFNISVDSLDPEVFKKITGMDRLEEILAGIDILLQLGVKRVKLNAVLMRGLNDDEAQFEAFLGYIKNRPVSVRYIELMQTGENTALFRERHVSAGSLRLRLLQSGWSPQTRTSTDGPAFEYTHPDFAGRIGIIAPYAEGFCTNCNRLRVSSRGGLRLCLFGTGEESLRDLLQSPDQEGQLMARVQERLGLKAPTHYLHEGNHGITRNLSAIGG
jgi:cyclic pyranopterin phosphate synthase